MTRQYACVPEASKSELLQITKLAATFRQKGPGGTGNRSVHGRQNAVFTAWEKSDKALLDLMSNYGPAFESVAFESEDTFSEYAIWLPTESTHNGIDDYLANDEQALADAKLKAQDMTLALEESIRAITELKN